MVYWSLGFCTTELRIKRTQFGRQALFLFTRSAVSTVCVVDPACVGLVFVWQNHKVINLRETGKLVKERYNHMENRTWLEKCRRRIRLYNVDIRTIFGVRKRIWYVVLGRKEAG
jgi:hypothetical protein